MKRLGSLIIVAFIASSSDMTKVDDYTYRVKVSDKLSNNGTRFSDQKQNISIFLNFGKVESVGLKSVVSLPE